MRIVNVDKNIITKLRESGISHEMKSIESCDWVVIEEEEEEGKVVGAAGLGGLFHVSVIQILKDYSGKGIGKRLQNELVNESKRRGYSFITMFNDPRNTVSAKLHDSLGYETIFRIHYSEEIINDVKAIGFKKKGRFVINFLKIFNSKSGMLLLGLILKILKSSFPSLITYNEDNLRSPDIRCMLKRFEKI